MQKSEIAIVGPEILPAAPQGAGLVPAFIAGADRRAQEEFLAFFAAEIANEATRESYLRDVARFGRWCEERRTGLREVTAIHMAAYREQIRHELAPTSVKRHFSALRRLFGWFVEKGVLERNPVREVRTERVARTDGKTPAFDVEDMQALFAALGAAAERGDLVALRDRALIAVMAYSFARVDAAVSLKVGDYFPLGRRSFLRLNEKGGKQREIPCHHQLEEYLDAYIEAAELRREPTSPLFRSAAGRTGRLTDRAMSRGDAYAMVQRRVAQAGIRGRFSNHSFRATGITTYLENGGTLEKAQWIAGHADSRTTKLYDRRALRAGVEDMERIRY